MPPTAKPGGRNSERRVRTEYVAARLSREASVAVDGPMSEPRPLGRGALVLIVGTVVLVPAALVFGIAGRPGAGGVNRSLANVAGPKRSAAGRSSPVGKPAATGHDEAGAISAARSIVAMEP